MTSRVTRVYSGSVVDLDVESVVLPNGERIELEIVRHPGGAAVVALDDRGHVCLLRQYRHATDGWLWELPAGKLEPGEPPLATARRELGEEAGVGAGSWSELGHVVSSPGVFTEVVHLYLARELTPVPARREHGELFEVAWIPLADACRRAVDGDISDAKTVAGLLRAASRLSERTLRFL